MNAVARLARPANSSDIAEDYLEGAVEIAVFLGPKWTERKVRHAREVKALPIRKKEGIGLYAFKSELMAALKSPESLSDLTPESP
jgi:hypothetical protein